MHLLVRFIQDDYPDTHLLYGMGGVHYPNKGESYSAEQTGNSGVTISKRVQSCL